MNENSKPEWFEIIDKDEKPELGKVSKSKPVSAVLAVLLILGAGAVVGVSKNQTPASANPTTAAVVVAEGVAANNFANPSIAKLPADDRDDDDHGREHHHDHGDHDEYEGDDD